MSDGLRWNMTPDAPGAVGFVVPYIQGMRPGDERMIEHDGRVWLLTLEAGFVDAVAQLTVKCIGDVIEDE